MYTTHVTVGFDSVPNYEWNAKLPTANIYVTVCALLSIIITDKL